MSFDRYLEFTLYDRWVLHDELSEQIERTNPDTGDPIGSSGRPKKQRQMR